jgi:hypothetical protein
VNPFATNAWALRAWCAAIGVNGFALFYNQVVMHGSGVGPGPALGIVSLFVQAVALWLIAAGNRAARWVLVCFAVIAVLPLPMIQRLISERAFYSAAYLTASLALKTIGTILLFSGAQRAN